ncbi:MAG: hypothetical protein ACREAE_01890 [Nitrosopumilaceae archaeon]
MFLSEKLYKKYEHLFERGSYIVIANPIRQNYLTADLTKEPTSNYLVVNAVTLAIEYEVNTLPHAYEIATGLSDALEKLGNKKPEATIN